MDISRRQLFNKIVEYDLKEYQWYKKEEKKCYEKFFHVKIFSKHLLFFLASNQHNLYELVWHNFCYYICNL
jgi:hypothetical protein